MSERFDHPMEVLMMRAIGLNFLRLVEESSLTDRCRWLRANLTHGPARTLDAGSGLGVCVQFAAQVNGGAEAVGVSIDDRENRHAEYRSRILGLKNTRFITWDLRRLDDLEIGAFDQVICFETLEHVVYDEALVAALSSKTKIGGRLLLIVPYALAYREDFAREMAALRARGIMEPPEDGRHVREGYTPEGLKSIVERHAFRVEKTEWVIGTISQRLMRFRQKATREFGSPRAALMTAPLKILRKFDPLLMRSGVRVWDSIAIVARRMP
ncbi:MAG: class I SAM-dependent methyltransferase [Euryarchaeota archaeon]|nr:class I SAM-dependent methyltransferase [Euryarchaeota archaeon]MDE1837517.1 class I SAM-dependent methyltransferase [Euryarchaeota archaeon]MDE2046496.1 class I SAM-dependent methyltransferase [Thermoplasmata archaeon]